jgi:shikimate dehydrogenase
MNTQPDQYAVMGNPIAHSQSPRIHTLFAIQTGQFMEYRAIRVQPNHFTEAVDTFRAEGGKGLNITVPFKQNAWIYADILSPRAERARAVNTLVFQESGSAFGENTDGIGLIRDLKKNHGFELKNKRILLLGAGGAAQGVLQPLLAEQPAKLVIANRTPSKAMEMALLFADLGRLSGCAFPELEGSSFDLIINATTASLQGEVPSLPKGLLAEGGWCYDLMYSAEPTAFVRWSHQQHAQRALDGLGMLVEQAAESFFLWRGIRPDTRPVIAKLQGHRP